jgi:hypothetical protein
MASIPLPGALSLLPQSVISLQYLGDDISSIILIRLSYHDRISYQADSLEFTIADPDGTFRNQFSFKAGNNLQFGLSALNWAYPGESLSQQYGEFSITRVNPAMSASGSTVDIKCSSVPLSSSFRLEMKFQRWTESTLSNIAGQIASDNSMQLSYQGTDQKIASIEQYDESDFVFLSRVAQTVGMSMKVRNNVITIFSRKDYESKPPKGFITFPPTQSGLLAGLESFGGSPSYGVNGTGGMISFSVTDNLDGIFKDCKVVIRSPISGLTTQSKYVDDPNNPQVGATLNIRKKLYPPSYPVAQAAPNGTFYDGNPQMQQTADALAYNELRRRAEKRHSLQITVPFCLKIESGDVWTMSNIGQDFDGNWIAIDIEQAISDAGSQTRGSFEKCLGW